MSDWFGVYSVSDSINAGLDLEMPGTRGFRSPYQVSWSIHARKTTLATVKERAHNVLNLVQKCAAGCPEVRQSLYAIESLNQLVDPRRRWERAH